MDSLVNALQAGLGTKLSTLEGEHNDDIHLDAPVDFLTGERALDRISNFPCVFILAEDTLVEGWNLHTLDNTTSVRVGVVVTDIDADKLKRKLYRYAEACFEVIIEADLGGWHPVNVARIGYSDTLTNGMQLMADCVLQWDYQNVEQR